MNGHTTRRGFLATTGAAGLGVGLELTAGTASGRPATHRRPEASPHTVPFYGEHQAGIATATQEHVQFGTLDVASDAIGDLRWILTRLSAGAGLLAQGKPVGDLKPADQPPVDTGEAVGLGPARVTVTFGLGPRVFAGRRFGLATRRPAPLIELPRFANDELVPRLCGGDIAVQVCADDPQVAFHAVHDLIRLVEPAAVPRWLLAGFGRTSNSRAQQTPRNLMGFKDGTNNVMVEDERALRRFVWAGPPASPPWMSGGSYMVVRRIAMNLGGWDDTSLSQQEQVFGRHKLSGAPLGALHEHDRVDLRARSHGRDVIPADAHIRLASPAYNRGERILRRGYSYVDGLDPAGQSVAGGQLFICYQRDPRRQFIPIQHRLARSDALGEHTTHVGSAIFACPPGAQPGGFVGETLFS